MTNSENKGVGSYKIGNNNSTTYDLVDYRLDYKTLFKLENLLLKIRN